MFFDFIANTLDLPFRNHISIAEKDHLIRDLVNFMKDVAGDDDMLPPIPKAPKQRKRFGSRHWVEPIQRLTHPQNSRLMRDRLCKPYPLPHALAVGSDLAI